MEIFGKRVPSKEVVLRVLRNLLLAEKDKKPLIAAFYGNDNCNGCCEFCSQKENTDGTTKQTDLATQKKILASIRKDVPNIYLMGGEPSIHPHLKELLIECENLDFDTIAVNTNAFVYKPEILEHANMLVLSLFSTDPSIVGSKLFPDLEVNKQARFGERVIENVRKYAKECDSDKTATVVNKVVTGEEGDIRECFELIRFCKELGIKLNIAPAIMPDNRPDPRLIDNSAWEFLIGHLLNNMDVMACSVEYLKTIKKFKDFDCSPNTIPTIRHNGDIHVPCPNVNFPEVVNLLKTGSVTEAIRQGREAFGNFNPSKDCPEQCHKTCYIESANLNSKTFVAEVMGKLFRKRTSEVIKGQDHSYINLLLKFCIEDMHDYDSGIGDYIKHIREKDGLFAKLIKELPDDELNEMRDILSEIWDHFDDRWKIASGGVQIAYIVTDTINQIATRPFTSVFRKIGKVLGGSFISDYTGARAMNRITRYNRIINKESSGRDKKIAV